MWRVWESNCFNWKLTKKQPASVISNSPQGYHYVHTTPDFKLFAGPHELEAYLFWMVAEILKSILWCSDRYYKIYNKIRELEILWSSPFCLIKTPINSFCNYRCTNFNNKCQLLWWLFYVHLKSAICFHSSLYRRSIKDINALLCCSSMTLLALLYSKHWLIYRP